MSHYFQLTVLALYSLMVLWCVIALIKTSVWLRKSGGSLKFVPVKMDLAYLAAVVVGSYFGLKIDHYFGWYVIEAFCYYGYFPILVFTMVYWMNRHQVTAYQVQQIVQGHYPVIMRVALYVIKLVTRKSMAA
jgi:hypothetical protein